MTSTEIRDMLLGPPVLIADCDRCGRPDTDIWATGDYSGDCLCRSCWTAQAAKQSAPRPSAPVQWHRQKQLLTGLDCAPGQGDLFDTNGSK